jgi:hypothetical protein
MPCSFPPARQNGCRPHRSMNPGAAMKDASVTIRTSVQGQSGGQDAAPRERAERVVPRMRAKLDCSDSYIDRWSKRFAAERLAGLFGRHAGRERFPTTSGPPSVRQLTRSSSGRQRRVGSGSRPAAGPVSLLAPPRGGRADGRGIHSCRRMEPLHRLALRPISYQRSLPGP